MPAPLPRLWGSPRQIKWAETIRQEKLAEWRSVLKPDDHAVVAMTRDASWWIANRVETFPKMPKVEQMGEPPAPSGYQSRQPRQREVPPELHGREVPDEDWENATPAVKPVNQHTGPRTQQAEDMVEFISEINRANHLAHALMLVLAAKLGDPAILKEAQEAVDDIKEQVAVIEAVLRSNPQLLSRSTKV